MSGDAVPFVPAGSSDIPFREFLVGLRARNVSGIALAIRRADPDQIAEALKDRDSRRIIDALNRNDVTEVVDALLGCDHGKLDALRRGRESTRIAAALIARDAKQLAAALRGRDPDMIIQAMRLGDLDQIVAALRDRGAGRKGAAITDRKAESLVSAIPEGHTAVRQIAESLCARDPLRALAPLPRDEVSQITDALENCDREEIIRVLLDRRGAIWEQILSAVMPRVALAVKRKFCRIPALAADDAIDSLAQSLVKTMLRRVELGKLQEYDLESPDDLVGLFVQIAWRKSCQKLRENHAISLSELPLGGEESSGGDWEPADPTNDPEADMIELEMTAQFHAVLDEVRGTLDCIDLVVLYNKLRVPPITNEEIAVQVEKECESHRMCSARTVRRHWHAIKAQLLARLPQ